MPLIKMKMSANKSFILIVDKERKNEVIRGLGKFCLNDKEYLVFTPERLVNDSDICISLDRDPELEYYTNKNEYTKRIPNKYTFGIVHIWIKENTKFAYFELWPITNSLFDVLNKSSKLKDYFVEIITNTEGYEFYIDNGNGSFEYVFCNNRE